MNMKKTNLTFMEKHRLIEANVNEILYNNVSCNKVFSRVMLSKDINTRKSYLTELVQNIVLKFHLY